MKGRKIILTRELVDLIVDHVRSVSTNTAARAVGLGRSTVHGFAKHGRDLKLALERGSVEPGALSSHDELCIVLADGIAQSMASAECEMSAKVREDPDWRAAAWWLSHRFGSRWHQRAEVTGARGGPLSLEVIDGILGSLPTEAADGDA